MNDFVCTRCGNNAGHSDPAVAAVGLCGSCREDDAHPDRPMCEQCGRRRVTCSEAAFNRGVRVCRGCAYTNTVDAAQLEYEPVLEIVRDFHDCRTYVEQTGGMCMVATVYLDAKKLGVGACTFCGMGITADAHGSWVDDTDGDGCAGSYDGANVNGVHTPAVDYPQVQFTYDSDEVWSIGYRTHWEDHEGFGIDSQDLPSGTDDHGVPIFDGTDCATAEDVAARILLLIDEPALGRM